MERMDQREQCDIDARSAGAARELGRSSQSIEAANYKARAAHMLYVNHV